MGLDLRVQTPVFASRIGSYTGFHEFRTAWAKLLGFNLDKMEGFGGARQWDRQPLRCFFDHTDCEGEIEWEDAEKILAQARLDAPKLPEFHHQFQVLIAACEAAVQHHAPIQYR